MISITAIAADGTSVLLRTLDGAVVESQLSTLVAAPSLATNGFGANAKFVAKSAAGQLRAIRATNANAAARYLQVHNTAALPAASATPVYSFPLPAGTAANPGVLDIAGFFLNGGATFSTGISIVISTTLGTFTDAATATEHTVHAHYV